MLLDNLKKRRQERGFERVRKGEGCVYFMKFIKYFIIN